MLLFLLPLLFNPFSLIMKWLPGIYLAAWPIMIQTLGRETLITHALVLILFILTCDISRRIMLNTIGFDLMSFPLGIGLLLCLTTDQGALFLSMIRPIFSGLLVVVEPLFLLIEIYLFMDMLRSFNKWLSAKANERDEDSDDLSNWEPPLSRRAVLARIAIIAITIASYIGVYMIIQHSKSLLEISNQVPINFNYAIAALVTLQLIALSATVYKEEGVLSESALAALLAAVPIFIAAWSYFHLIETANTKSSPWSSYFPFSLFAGSSADDSSQLGGASGQPDADPLHLLGDSVGGGGGGRRGLRVGSGPEILFANDELGYHQIDIGPLEKAVRRMDGLDYGTRQLLLTLARRLIMVINSVLGLSLDKLAKYYFGPDFWYILAGRFVCLSWWALVSVRRSAADAADADEGDLPAGDNKWSGRQLEPGAAANPLLAAGQQIRSTWRRLTSWLPVGKRSLVKILLVLAYTQMLIQQMDNKHHLEEQVSQLGSDTPDQRQRAAATTCCGSAASAPSGPVGGSSAAETTSSDLSAWFGCMWDSAKACSGGGNQASQSYGSRASRLYGLLVEQLAAGGEHLHRLVGSLDLASVYHVWLARWRSNIVQRLCQSMLVQVYYITHLLFVYD